jgi:hypothetical protein
MRALAGGLRRVCLGEATPTPKTRQRRAIHVRFFQECGSVSELEETLTFCWTAKLHPIVEQANLWCEHWR